MSQQQFYQTVQRQEEWENDMKLKSFAEQMREEMSQSSTEYCCYCLTPKEDKYGCCHENHFVTFNDFPKEDQDFLIQEEVDAYTKWSAKQ